MNVPIYTGPREPRTNPTRLEAVLLKMLYVPRLDACGTEKDPTAHL